MFALFLLMHAGDVPAVPVLPAPATPVCMTRSVVDAKGTSHGFPIVVTTADQATLADKGFVVTSCAATRLRAASYQEQICKMAVFGNEAVQNRFEQVLGVRPKLLCERSKQLGASLAAALGS